MFCSSGRFSGQGRSSPETLLGFLVIPCPCTGNVVPSAAYVLRSLLPPALRRYALPEPPPLCALAMTVFSIIHLNGGSIAEGARACLAHFSELVVRVSGPVWSPGRRQFDGGSVAEGAAPPRLHGGPVRWQWHSWHPLWRQSVHWTTLRLSAWYDAQHCIPLCYPSPDSPVRCAAADLWKQLEDLGLEPAAQHAQFQASPQEQLDLLVKQRCALRTLACLGIGWLDSSWTCW